MHYLKLFESFSSKEELENGINTILLPIYDYGYRFNIGYSIDPESIIITILSDDNNSEDFIYIKGSEIKESILTLIDFLKLKTNNTPKILIWSDQDYAYISIDDTDTHGIKDIDDLKGDYAETDAIRIITQL